MSQARYPQRKLPWKSPHCAPIKAWGTTTNALGAGHECGSIGTIVGWHSAPVTASRPGATGHSYTSPTLLAELTDILGRRKFGKKIAASGFSVDELAPYETNTGYLCLIRNPNPNPQEE